MIIRKTISNDFDLMNLMKVNFIIVAFWKAFDIGY